MRSVTAASAQHVTSPPAPSQQSGLRSVPSWEGELPCGVTRRRSSNPSPILLHHCAWDVAGAVRRGNRSPRRGEGRSRAVAAKVETIFPDAGRRDGGRFPLPNSRNPPRVRSVFSPYRSPLFPALVAKERPTANGSGLGCPCVCIQSVYEVLHSDKQLRQATRRSRTRGGALPERDCAVALSQKYVARLEHGNTAWNCAAARQSVP